MSHADGLWFSANRMNCFLEAVVVVMVLQTLWLEARSDLLIDLAETELIGSVIHVCKLEFVIQQNSGLCQGRILKVDL